MYIAMYNSKCVDMYLSISLGINHSDSQPVLGTFHDHSGQQQHNNTIQVFDQG